MKWTTHITVTRQVLEQLAHRHRLPLEFVESVVEASTEPDRLPDLKYVVDRRGRVLRPRPVFVKHHDLADIESLVDYYVRLAVWAFVRGRYRLAGRALGRAIHYVQDAVLVQVPHSLEHSYVEELVDNAVRTRIALEEQPISLIIRLLYERTYEVITKFLELAARSRHAAALIREAKRHFVLDVLAALITVLFISGVVAALYVMLAGVVLGTILVLGLVVYSYARYTKIRDLETRYGLKRPPPPPLYKTAI